MIVSLSAVVLLAALVYFLIRYAGLRPWQALVCTLFGFFLATSSIGPAIASACRAIAGYLAGLDL